MIKLRYHHLLCVPRFEGKGYSEDFCRNLADIKERLNTENYMLTDSADDICAACPNLINGICKDNKKVSAYDRAVKEALKSNRELTPLFICSDCQWFPVCSKK